MYKCFNCGHLFEEGEYKVIREDWGETFYVCPVCRGDYDEAYICLECGEWYTGEELYSGWCEKCLRENIDYDTFFEYCEVHKDERYLDIFVMSELLGGMDCPENISWDFHQLMIDTYKRKVAEAKLFDKTKELLDACIRFIMDDDGSIGRENYADWLNKREVK